MKQILVQVDDRLAAQLEKLAPGRSHKRSAFVRRALARAVEEELERKTREAYEKWPDEPAEIDARAWAPEAEAIHPPDKDVAATKTSKRKPRAKKRATTKEARSRTTSGRR